MSPVARISLISSLIISGDSFDVVFEYMSTTFNSAFLSFHFLFINAWLWFWPAGGSLFDPLIPFKGEYYL